MLSGTGTDLSTKLEEVSIVIVWQNVRMTQGLCNLSKQVLKGFLAEQAISKADNADFAQLQKDITEGKEASQTICDYKSRLRLTVRVNVVLNRTVVFDSYWHFDNLCGSHLQSQSELYHVGWWYYTLVIDLIGQSEKWPST